MKNFEYETAYGRAEEMLTEQMNLVNYFYRNMCAGGECQERNRTKYLEARANFSAMAEIFDHTFLMNTKVFNITNEFESVTGFYFSTEAR